MDAKGGREERKMRKKDEKPQIESGTVRGTEGK